ncbi:MAG: hypothetical protein E6Q97_10000 [Desulfurellales bacterium]|nr:MAG: hypothetical protein E6Q97_10000 [Desulfurellales bacterium]
MTSTTSLTYTYFQGDERIKPWRMTSDYELSETKTITYSDSLASDQHGVTWWLARVKNRLGDTCVRAQSARHQVMEFSSDSSCYRVTIKVEPVCCFGPDHTYNYTIECYVKKPDLGSIV